MSHCRRPKSECCTGNRGIKHTSLFIIFVMTYILVCLHAICLNCQKFPSEFAASFGSMGLNNIGLHLPMTNSWLARYVSSSETVEGLEKLFKTYNVNPWYMFVFKYIGGTEFQVEIFNEYAVEIDYSKRVACSNQTIRATDKGRIGSNPVFDLTDIEKISCPQHFHTTLAQCLIWSLKLTSIMGTWKERSTQR